MRISRTVAVVLTGLVLAAGCAGTDEASVPKAGADAESSAALEEPDEASDEAEGGEDRSTPASEQEAVAIHSTRWVALPNPTGTVSVQLFAIVENVSDLVHEVRVEAEMLDADGQVIGRSGPQPFLERIGPGDRLPVRLAGRTGEEPADVVPRMQSSELADFKQERYGTVRISGEVSEYSVGDDTITARVEVTNTGQEPSVGAVTYYLAAFDDQDALVAAEPGFVLEDLPPGSSVTVDGEMAWRSEAGDEVDRVEIFFTAVSS